MIRSILMFLLIIFIALLLGNGMIGMIKKEREDIRKCLGAGMIYTNPLLSKPYCAAGKKL